MAWRIMLGTSTGRSSSSDPASADPAGRRGSVGPPLPTIGGTLRAGGRLRGRGGPPRPRVRLSSLAIADLRYDLTVSTVSPRRGARPRRSRGPSPRGRGRRAPGPRGAPPAGTPPRRWCSRAARISSRDRAAGSEVPARAARRTACSSRASSRESRTSHSLGCRRGSGGLAAPVPDGGPHRRGHAGEEALAEVDRAPHRAVHGAVAGAVDPDGQGERPRAGPRPTRPGRTGG